MSIRLAVLDSGSGETLQALLDACHTGHIVAQVTVHVSSQRDARALDRAEMAGITALYHPLDWFAETGRSLDEYVVALADLIAPYAPDYLVLLDWDDTTQDALQAAFPDRVINANRMPTVDALTKIRTTLAQ